MNLERMPERRRQREERRTKGEHIRAIMIRSSFIGGKCTSCSFLDSALLY